MFNRLKSIFARIKEVSEERHERNVLDRNGYTIPVEKNEVEQKFSDRTQQEKNAYEGENKQRGGLFIN